MNDKHSEKWSQNLSKWKNDNATGMRLLAVNIGLTLCIGVLLILGTFFAAHNSMLIIMQILMFINCVIPVINLILCLIFLVSGKFELALACGLSVVLLLIINAAELSLCAQLGRF